MQFAPLFPILHQILSPLFPGCLWQGNPQRREIALTFDDGPHPEYTPPLLQVLEQFQVKASFFWLGLQVERSPDLAREIVAQGHWIGSHGYDHLSFHRLTPQQLQHTLNRTQTAIAQACGLAPTQIRDVRPPYGLFTPQTLHWLKHWHYRTVMWSVVPEDWASPGIPIVIRRLERQTRNGSILVLHDGCKGGAAAAQTTAQLIPLLQEQGYQFVTIDQLWQEL
jgi:peptidoglycan/xylan/chitin deacetylase (PgdA/CDA1 family)